MKRIWIIVINVAIMAVLVIGDMRFVAPPAHAQEEVFLPFLSGSLGEPDNGIDLTGVDGETYEVRSADAVPVGKGAAEYGNVVRHRDKLIPATTPLSVRLLSSGVPLVDQAITVELQVYAYDAAPNTKVEIGLPAGVEVLGGTTKAKFDMAAGQTRSINASISFREVGEYEIAAFATSVVSVDAGIVYADLDQFFFTIGAEVSVASAASGNFTQLQSEQGADIVDDAIVEAADAEDLAVIAASYPDDMDEAKALAEDEKAAGENPDAGREDLSVPSVEDDAIGDGTLNAAATRTISFCWRFYDRDSTAEIPKSLPLRDAYYKIYDQNGSVGGGDDDLLGTGYLGYTNGCASKDVSDADGSGTADVYVEVWLTHSGRYRVSNNSGTIWFARSATKTNITGDIDFGTLYFGNAAFTGNGRSGAIWNDLYWTRYTINLRRGALGSDPGFVDVRWQTGSTTGTYYSLTSQHIRLMDADVQSADTVVHEAMHNIMDNVYGGSFWPTYDCPSPHNINKISGKGCAWSEGYTYLFTTIVNGDPSYDWPSGGSLNMETPECSTANWDDGPAVEGRIAGTLIDLADPFTGLAPPRGGAYTGLSDEVTGCYEDGASGYFDGIWDLISDQEDNVFVSQDGETNSFSNAWESRQYPRYIPGRTADHNTVSTFTHD